MVAPSYGIVLLLAAGGIPDLLGSPFCLGVSYQNRMLASLPEVHVLHNPDPDLSGLADAQRLRENDNSLR